VQPTVASAAPRFAHPEVVCLPIADLPLSSTALAWRRGSSDARLSAFLDVARDLLRAASADEPSPRPPGGPVIGDGVRPGSLPSSG